MEEINLLQNRVKDNSIAWKRQGSVVSTILWVILILLILAGGGLFLLNKNTEQRVASITAENDNLKKKVADKQANLTAATNFQAQLVNIKTLVNTHTYLTPLLDELAKWTYAKAQFMTLDVLNNGKIHLEGRVANYNDLGKLMMGLSTSDQFKNIRLLSVSPAAGKISAYQFAVDLEVSSAIFKQK